MKQDLEGRKLFRQIVDETPAELKMQLRFSDSIAEKMDSLLKERGMSQRELAKSTGKTEAEVSRWLGGTHNFTLRTLAKISIALGEDLITVC
jgi:DNA-binding Xre family transcriptional regulator